MRADEFQAWHMRMLFSSLNAGAEALHMSFPTYRNYYYGARPVPPQIELLCQMVEEKKMQQA